MLSRQDAKEKESETVAKAQTAVEIPIEDAPRVTAAQAKASIDIVVED